MNEACEDSWSTQKFLEAETVEISFEAVRELREDWTTMEISGEDAFEDSTAVGTATWMILYRHSD